MTDNPHDPPRVGQRIILIGGPMTVDDGSTLDSRQPVTGDPASNVTRVSLATSLLWWTTASSLVGQILDSKENDPYALSHRQSLGGRASTGRPASPDRAALHPVRRQYHRGADPHSST